MPSKDIIPSKLHQAESNSNPTGKTYLFFIAIDRYKNGIGELNNAVNDARAVSNCLVNNYELDKQYLKTLFNEEATNEAIIQAFAEYHDQITDQDNLLFYFSGHGYYDKRNDTGYWVTAESKKANKQTYFSNHEVISYLRKLNARHVFGIVDSCFSGSLFRGQDSYSTERYNSPSRWLLTAGRLGLVSDGSLGDNSPFAKSLLDHLRYSKKPILWVSELCALVVNGVPWNAENQTPRGEPLGGVGHQGGEFMFLQKGHTFSVRNNPQEAQEEILRKFNVALSPPLTCFIDSQNRLWIYNSYQAQIFWLDKENAISRITFLKKKWKNFFPYPQNDKLIASDWAGNLFMINENQNDSSLMLGKAKAKNLPIHLLEPIDETQFVVATWDGKIILFCQNDAEGNYTLNKIAHLSYLPKNLAIVKNREMESEFSFLIVDQKHRVYWFDKKGLEKNSWQLDQSVVDLWSFYQGNQCNLIVIAKEKVFKLQTDLPNKIETILSLSAEVADFSHRKKDKRSVIACKDGIISWLTWNPFGIVEGDNIQLVNGIKQIEAFYDPERPGILMALGLTTAGYVFTIQDREVEISSAPSLHYISLDNDKRFMVLLHKKGGNLKKIPIISSRIFLVECSLKNNKFSKTNFHNAIVVVKNTGNYKIPYLKASLTNNKVIASAGALTGDFEDLEVGQTSELIFSIRGMESGTVPLSMQVQIFDEVRDLADTKTVAMQIQVV